MFTGRALDAGVLTLPEAESLLDQLSAVIDEAVDPDIDPDIDPDLDPGIDPG